MNIKELQAAYNALTGEDRNGQAGEDILTAIQKRRRPRSRNLLDTGDYLIGCIGVDGSVTVPACATHVKISTTAVFSPPCPPLPVEVKRSGNNRNLPCPCGSGRKFKKCCFYLDTPIHITP